MDSTAYSLPYKEASLGKDDCWLRNLEPDISAMKQYAESGDCDFTCPDVPIPANYTGHSDTMQKLSRMKTVIDEFAVRVFESKKEAYTSILKEVSGIYSALRSINAGAPLLRVQVNSILLPDTAPTMKIGRSILKKIPVTSNKLPPGFPRPEGLHHATHRGAVRCVARCVVKVRPPRASPRTHPAPFRLSITRHFVLLHWCRRVTRHFQHLILCVGTR